MPHRTHDAICEQWVDILSEKKHRTQLLSKWSKQLSARAPSALRERSADLRVLLEHFLDALSEGLWSRPWSMEDAAFRDAAKSASVLAGWCVSIGVGPGWVASLYAPLLELSVDGTSPPCPQWPLLIQQVTALSAEAYFAVMRQRTEEERARMLAEHTPILRLAPNLPALIVVADPPPTVWEDLLDRLLTEAVRTGASAMVVDLSHSSLPRSRALASLSRFAAYKHARQRRTLVIGLGPHEPLQPSNLLAVASLSQAVAEYGDGASN